MICGTMRRILENKVRPKTKIKLYKSVTFPALLFGGETWIKTRII